MTDISYQGNDLPAPRANHPVLEYVRYNGLFIAAALDLASSGGATVGALIKTFTKNTSTYADATLSAALFLWTAYGGISLYPVSGVKPPEGPISDSESKRLDRQVTIRNRVIMSSSIADGLASGSYLASGLLTGNHWIAAAGAMYTVAAGIHLFCKQGEDVPPPVFAQPTSLSTKAIEYAKYAKEIVYNNPNMLAEAVILPGLVVSSIGLIKELPWYFAATSITGHGIASVLRSYTVAQQETLELKQSAPNTPPPRPNSPSSHANQP